MKITTMAALSAMLLLAACASSKTEKEKKIEYDDIIRGLSVSGEEILYRKDKSTDFYRYQYLVYQSANYHSWLSPEIKPSGAANYKTA
ncbi:hypothetical protein NFJ68_10305 [Klebsiella aerogenes]|uniref:hypothetical protein n=1 Tax=Klebsiella TaxID=570 RepID=UPI0005E4A747|nr:hypothetical protein [Klebsiella aerogenes]EIY2648680.1 hypothetical protein [Klebsiella aerogenes]EKT8944641.1 hypothetical protein [Klebsiella aerogenes]EKU0405965.1 hypothetical protein [Klebsiella aerogenes]EKU2765812.1 hypothetical protein [Klebsiella aerogenes]EKV8595589.1 hypothetical protein [Klebsiella aerogenes]